MWCRFNRALEPSRVVVSNDFLHNVTLCNCICDCESVCLGGGWTLVQNKILRSELPGRLTNKNSIKPNTHQQDECETHTEDLTVTRFLRLFQSQIQALLKHFQGALSSISSALPLWQIILQGIQYISILKVHLKWYIYEIFPENKVANLQEESQVYSEIKVGNLWEKNSDIHWD